MIAGHFVSGGERPVRPGDQPHEAVISERLWARVFGSDPQAVGERIAVDLYLPLNVARMVVGDASCHRCAHGTWSGGLPTA